MIDIFKGFDFRELYSHDFKEDSVREVLILPILAALGYNQKQIVRSKTLAHPFVKIGSQKRAVNIVPDYLLQVEESYAWVLDAKSPNENIFSGGNVEQVYSYAIHPDIRTKFYALCNGNTFALFRDTEAESFFSFPLMEIGSYWEELSGYLSPNSFQSGKKFTYATVKKAINSKGEFEYLSRPLLEELPVQKQAAKRHFGVHGYFTKQSWNVVQQYIMNFSQVGDLVLDPFGGSGVTAIEALVIGRKAIHIDLNPMSVFMVDSLVAPVKIHELTAAFDKVKVEFNKMFPTNQVIDNELIKKILAKYSYPKGLILPKNSDVTTIEQLFSDKQLAQLAYLKQLILKEKTDNIRKTLLLAFSSTLTKINLTYHNSSSRDENAGNSAIFAYYRYRISHEDIDLDLMKTFETKFKKVVNAKKEISPQINENTIDNIEVVKGTATDLSFIKKESVDYIYTDPPYGKKIPYLDLSVMWNGWLDLAVTEQDYELEAIEGGEHDKTKDEYNDLMSKSIAEMYRVLKFDRWMSFVFAHKDPEFWHLIVETAEKCGFEYAGAVKQGNGQTSFKKRQNPFTVLAGQLIINFKKVKRPRAIMKAALGMGIGEIIFQTIEGIIAKNNGATLEDINDELIIKGLEMGFLDLLKKEYSDLSPILLDTFDYNQDTGLFTIRKNTKFKTHVDLDLRIRYYLISFLRRQELEGKTATFDEIALHVIPLLKNGITPEHQTVLNVLEDIAEKVGSESWQLKKGGQQKLFS